MIDPSVGRNLCFERGNRTKTTISRDKKRYHGTKNDITEHIVFMSPCYCSDVCDKKVYHNRITQFYFFQDDIIDVLR